jgi:hypothetical protein
MKIEFLRSARDEFLSAVSYYDSSQQGLGDQFFEEVWSTFQGLLNILAPGNRSL